MRTEILNPDGSIARTVDGSGTMWVMTGQHGSGLRTTTDLVMWDGSRMRLRFIREAVTRDRFESRMDYSIDAAATRAPGNSPVPHAPDGR